MIRNILFPSFIAASLGLPKQDRPLERLGKIVVLAGPNGAGKSRYLKLMQMTVQHVRSAPALIAQFTKQLGEHRSNLARFQADITIPAASREQLIANHISAIDKQEDQIRDLTRAQEHLEVVGDLESFEIATLTYEMNRQHVVPARDLTPVSAESYVNANVPAGFVGAYRSIPAYFQRIARALWHSDHPQAQKDTNASKRVCDARSFNDTLFALVNGRVEPSLDENQEVIAKFRGRTFDYSELSSGETVLVTWAIILHRQGQSLSNAVVVIDEPENHLHPDACIKALKALRDQILIGPYGQIWLATHSVQLIAFAGIDSICFVEGGRIEYGGNKVDTVIESLLGGEDARDQLRIFLADADAVGFYKFAAECLLPPSVAPRLNDPQEAQLVTQVKSRIAESDVIRVLDFGAGKGRLAAALREGLVASQHPVGTLNFHYHAYNGPYSSMDERNECRARVAELGTITGVHASYVEQLRELQLEAAPRMDMVVLCNVLHEIRLDRWLAMFNDIRQVLSPVGSLIILEDQTMRVGELPTAEGFLVLDILELAALFGTTPGEGVRPLQSSRTGRLTQIEVSAGVLANASMDRIKMALTMVQKRATEEVELLRSRSESSFQAGQRHAYYSTLFMNATLGLRSFG